jgi:hypothetical protein
MLVKTPAQKGDVVTLKLTTGEEVVATYQDDDTQSITVSKCVCLVPQQEGMGLAPWLLTAPDDSVEISKANVVVWLKSQQELARMYTQATTGIQLAQ